MHNPSANAAPYCCSICKQYNATEQLHVYTKYNA